MPDNITPRTAPVPGIYQMTADEYGSTDAISKSGLWTIRTRSPYHYRYQHREETNAMQVGTAYHCALLEPGHFEARFFKGPDDRRGNKWAAACEIARQMGRECLRSDDFDNALRLRDAMSKNALVQRLVSGTPSIEQSAFWIDEETGVLCRCRPDIYNHDLRLMADVKITGDASGDTWQRLVGKLGYHAQQAMYADGWEQAGGGAVDAFVFLTIERDPPFCHQIFELLPGAVAKGEEIVRETIRTYADCRRKNDWPGYPSGVVALDLKPWDYGDSPRDAAYPE